MSVIIVKMIFGSHLYGTETENSDKDYKGIFLPSKKEIFLGNIQKSIQENTKSNSSTKNTSEDVDYELYSLHYFLKMACAGETATLDMLHAPENMLLSSSNTWDYIVANRHRFYTKNLSALIGYARRQASKYGVKGSRLNDAREVLDYCVKFNFEERANTKLKNYWKTLPEGEHIFKHETPDANGVRMYEVCGRKIGETCSIAQLFIVVKTFHDAYGERARKAALDVGIDWKAVSHAIRAAYQVKEILTEGNITFPLREAKFIKSVKNGELPFSKVRVVIDELMEEVEELSGKSTLPESVDKEWWDNFLIDVIDEEIRDNII